MCRLDPAKKTTLLIELAALDPFAPFQLDWGEANRDAGLAAIAELIGLEVGDAQRVLDTFIEASRAHREISLLRIGMYTVAGAAAIGGRGFLLRQCSEARLELPPGWAGPLQLPTGSR